MSEIKLFRLSSNGAAELEGDSVAIEKSLQTLIEKNCDTFLGVAFLASEYSTGKVHAGRIDTLGIDENNCPTIIEYKRATNQNVINQGLFYLNWLLDHKAEFKLLVMEQLGQEKANAIDWSAPRLICIAGGFTRYDENAVEQIGRNIDLMRYRRFGHDLLALQLVRRLGDQVLDDTDVPHPGKASTGTAKTGDKPVEQAIADAEPAIRDLYFALRVFLLSLGDDVQEKRVKLYMVYRRIKNFACVVIQKKTIYIYLKLDPSQVQTEEGFTRDVRQIGHWGTGDLEVALRSGSDLKRAESLITESYGAN